MNTPTVAFESSEVTLHHGDCLDVLASLPDASVDSVVTDPPYGLEFMGKDWDAPWKASSVGRGVRVAEERAAEMTAKGKGHATAGGPFLASRVDSVRVAGRPFQDWCESWAREALRVLKPGGHMLAFGGTRTWHRLTVAVEDAGFEIRDSIAWMYGSGFPKSMNIGDGLGTALKPAFEPVVVARKPLAGTVAANVLKYGTGSLNIDASRIGSEERPVMVRTATEVAARSMSGTSTGATSSGETTTAGRFPANVILDEHQAAELDKQSGILTSGMMRAGAERRGNGDVYGADDRAVRADTFGDSGGASRFFYTAKADSAERPVVDGVAHPTVKPLDLMRYLVRLVTPKGGVVLEPFAGSGTTLEAAVLEGFRAIGIEREADYLPLILKRLEKPHAVGLDLFGDVA